MESLKKSLSSNISQTRSFVHQCGLNEILTSMHILSVLANLSELVEDLYIVTIKIAFTV